MVSLGQVGRNVAAGMTGGLGYFYDDAGDFPDLVNSEIVAIQRVQTAAGEAQLRGLIEAHVERTGERVCGVCGVGWGAGLTGAAPLPPACRPAYLPALAGWNGTERHAAGAGTSSSLLPLTMPAPPPPAGSPKGKALLADWASAVQKFWQLVPPSEANSPQANKAADEAAAAGAVGGVAVAATA